MGVHSLPLPVTHSPPSAGFSSRSATLVLVLVVAVAGRLTCIVVGLAQTRGGAHTTDSINKPRPGL